MGLGTQWSLSMVVMPLVTLLLSLPLGAAQMCALQRSGHQCMIPNWPNFQLPSLALGSRCQCQFSPASLPKPIFTTKGLRHNLNRPRHHQQSAHNRLGTSAGRSKRQGLNELHCGNISHSSTNPCKQPSAQLSCLTTAWPPATGWHSSVPWILSQTLLANRAELAWVIQQLSECKWSQAYLLPIRRQRQLQFQLQTQFL